MFRNVWYVVLVTCLFISLGAFAQDADNDKSGATAHSDIASTPAVNNSTNGSYIATNTSNNFTESSPNATNESNNPATPKRQIILQNFFMPSPHGYDGQSADVELLRLYLPFKFLGVENIFRVYQPIETTPLLPEGRTAGFGDTEVYDLVLHRRDKFTIGAGPLLILPVASHNNLGAGKWQAGAAGMVVMEKSWGIVGAIISYQHSFSGYGSDRPTTRLVSVQPIVHYNFNKGYYLRSSGIWNLNNGSHASEIPVGFGAGKVWTLPGGTVMNIYVEPQYSVYRTGTGAPIWQVLSAVTFQFPVRAKRSLP